MNSRFELEPLPIDLMTSKYRKSQGIPPLNNRQLLETFQKMINAILISAMPRRSQSSFLPQVTIQTAITLIETLQW